MKRFGFLEKVVSLFWLLEWCYVIVFVLFHYLCVEFVVLIIDISHGGFYGNGCSKPDVFLCYCWRNGMCRFLYLRSCQ
jgi:hypothetical protein